MKILKLDQIISLTDLFKLKLQNLLMGDINYLLYILVCAILLKFNKL
jgi:hypothetical protein